MFLSSFNINLLALHHELYLNPRYLKKIESGVVWPINKRYSWQNACRFTTKLDRNKYKYLKARTRRDVLRPVHTGELAPETRSRNTTSTQEGHDEGVE